MILTFAAFFSLIWTVIDVIAHGVPFGGYGTIISTLLLGIGIITLILGIIGEYLALIYEEVKGRPNYVISQKIGL